MDWEAIGAIGELLGATAVLATLVYVAVQVRHSRALLEENRKISLSQVYAARAAQRIQHIYQNIDSDHIARLVAEEFGVTEDEFRWREIDQRHIVHFDNILYQNELGLITTEDMERLTKVMVDSYPGWRKHGSTILPRCYVPVSTRLLTPPDPAIPQVSL